jgi:DNA ligase 1
MSWDGEPDFTYYVFDQAINQGGYETRLADLSRYLSNIEYVYRGIIKIVIVEAVEIATYDELLAYEKKQLAKGYEGIILRDAKSLYKQGKATEKEGSLWRIKRFEDSEGVIVGFEEGMSNQNAAQTNELGHTKRSSSKAGKVPMGTMGAIKMRDEKNGWDLSVGTGFTPAQRQEIWNNREQLLGKIGKYSFFRVGSGESARFPSWIGLRDPLDL